MSWNWVSKVYLRQAYFVLFQSHVCCCCCHIMGPCAQCVFLRKKAIRIVSNTGFRGHGRPIFINSEIVTTWLICMYFRVFWQLRINLVLCLLITVWFTNTAVEIMLIFPLLQGITFHNSLPKHIRDLPNANFKILAYTTFVILESTLKLLPAHLMPY